MKLLRPISVLPFLLSLGLFAMQDGEFRGYGRRQYYQPGPNVPSEFYWSRLQYTSSYTSGSSFGYRGFRSGWSRDYPKASTTDCSHCPAPPDAHQLAVPSQRR